MVIFHDSARSAGPPSALSVQEVNTDASGDIRVHEQGTATVSINNLPSTQTVNGTVTVSNFPATQNVSGTVNVGNLPLDGSGNVKIASPSAPKGRVINAMSGRDVTPHQFVDGSWFDTSDCRSIAVFIQQPSIGPVQLEPRVGLSVDGHGFQDIPELAASGSTWYPIISGLAIPVTAPFTRVDVSNTTGDTVHMDGAFIYCGH